MSFTVSTVPLARLVIDKQLAPDICLPSPVASNLGSPALNEAKPSISDAAAPVVLPLSPTSPAKQDDDPLSPVAHDEEDELSSSSAEGKKDSAASHPSSGRKCNYCGATSTPMWRHGPGSYTNLCNSCGVKWRRGKILANDENRHHLCKNTAAVQKAKKEKSALKKASGHATPTSSVDKATSPSATTVTASTSTSTLSEKRKALGDDWESAPRQRKSRTCARQLWNTASNTSDDDDDQMVVPHAVDKATSPVRSKVDIVTSAPPALNTYANSRLQALTNEFAQLLEKLPSSKTVQFTSLLAKSFEPKVAHAYQAGYEVEMSVLDITPDTWAALRALVC
ncbi:hypothetical protein HDV03_003517 [Kappamyces sp. JEL0829]|nr:hypothetical protein HDV03_003517 [Kappamyces sp. JEL0829]